MAAKVCHLPGQCWTGLQEPSARYQHPTSRARHHRDSQEAAGLGCCAEGLADGDLFGAVAEVGDDGFYQRVGGEPLCEVGGVFAKGGNVGATDGADELEL